MQCSDQMEMVGPSPAAVCGQKQCLEGPHWTCPELRDRSQHACVVLSLFLASTHFSLSNLSVRGIPSGCGGTAPSGWLPLTGVLCAAHISK